MLRQTNREIRHSIFWGISVGLAIGLAFLLGFFTNDLLSTSVTASAAVEKGIIGYPLLDEVQDLIDSNYLREQPSYQERQYAAIRGMLGSLDDRYTFFIDPPVAQSESDVLAGTYGGVGVQIQRTEQGELQMFPFDDSPAQEAGILPGDVLIAIDDEAITFEMRQDVTDQLLRGEVRRNNGVNITYARDGLENFQTVFVPFGVINVPSVVWRVLAEAPEIGYVQILRFTNRTPQETEMALEELQDAGIQGLVVDLRDNSGGLLQESVDVADAFLDGGVIVYEKNTDGERSFDANPGAIVKDDISMVVLVNNGTASAAELVAGAIGDRDRALLIGQRTFGKGTVQQIYRLSDESSIHITSAEWFTPRRYQLDGQGIEPDIAMIPDENGRDVELGEAIRHLTAEIGD
jgi:carboxyl-terminal processing protease